jgi:hypothetical protein
MVSMAFWASHFFGVPRGRGQEIDITLSGVARHAKLRRPGGVTFNHPKKGDAYYEGNDKHTNDRQEVELGSRF